MGAIDWILAREDMVRFIRLKPKKQQRIISEKQNEVKAKQNLLMRRIREARPTQNKSRKSVQPIPTIPRLASNVE